MPRWNFETDIDWDRFDRSRLRDDTLKLIRAAALTEFNAARYTAYMNNVFKDDAEFQAFAYTWQAEEEQHGRALGRYAEVADPDFDFKSSFERFTAGYVIPVDVDASVRGSRVGEMVARCVVETGTSAFYTALSEATDEPVLQEICRHIAGDEFRHYKLFLDTLRRYQPTEHVSIVERIRVAIGRLRETDDDELAFAFHCANEPGDAPYDRERAIAAYGAHLWGIYRLHHVERATGMVLKATGIKPQGWVGRQATRFAWWILRGKAHRVADHYA